MWPSGSAAAQCGKALPYRQAQAIVRLRRVSVGKTAARFKFYGNGGAAAVENTAPSVRQSLTTLESGKAA